jgi:hypothetical protein
MIIMPNGLPTLQTYAVVMDGNNGYKYTYTAKGYSKADAATQAALDHEDQTVIEVQYTH